MPARLTFRLDDATERGLVAIAIREGRAVADVARRLLREGLAGYQPEGKAPAPPTEGRLTAILRRHGAEEISGMAVLPLSTGERTELEKPASLR